MSNCKLQPLYFASIKFEVLDEFEGEQGTFIKSFLISDKLNLNDWEVTKQANILDGPDFKGMPGIEFFKGGRRDHTVGESYSQALKLQSPHSKAVIRKVLGAETGIKLEQISRVFDENMIRKLKDMQKAGKDLFVSPAIFPRSIDDVEIIEKPGGGHIHRVHRYLPLHYAFVDEPAFGPEAKISDICEGKDCMVQLQKAKVATDGIGQDGIDPLRTIPIIRVSKCSVTGNVTVKIAGDEELTKLVNEKLSKKLKHGEEPTDKQITSSLLEAKEVLKSNNSQILQSKKHSKKMANEDITRDEFDKQTARLQAIEDENKKDKEEAKKSKSKKANQNEPNNEKDMLETAVDDDDLDKDKETAKKSKKSKRANEDETKKEKEQTAKIATLTKIANTPIVEQYISARKMIGDSEEQLQATKEQMLTASVEDNQARLDEIKPFLAQIQFNTEAPVQESASTKFPMGMGGTQMSASSKSAEELFTELYD